MKQKLGLLLISLLLGTLSFSQKNEKIFYDSDWKGCSKSDAMYYRLVTYDLNGKPEGKIYDYYITGELQTEIDSAKFIDKFDDSKSIFIGRLKGYYKNGIKRFENINSESGILISTKSYFETGILQEEASFNENEELHGIYILYYSNGNKSEERLYKNNIMISAIQYYENGSLLEVVSFNKNNQLDGLYIVYHQNGKKDFECTYKNGKINGTYLKYNEEGKPKVEEVYNNGVLVGIPSLYFYHNNEHYTFCNYNVEDKDTIATYNQFTIEGDFIRSIKEKNNIIFGFETRIIDGVKTSRLNDNFKNNINDWSFNNTKDISIYIDNGLHFLFNTENKLIGRSTLQCEKVNFNDVDFVIKATIDQNSTSIFNGINFGSYRHFFTLDLCPKLETFNIEETIDGIVLHHTSLDETHKMSFYQENTDILLTIKKEYNKLIFAINGEIEYIIDNPDISGNIINLESCMGHGIFTNIEIIYSEDNPIILEGDYKGNGSGFFIDKKGFIATNYHVVENANDIEVEFVQNEQRKSYKAEIVHNDKQNDLSVIKINDNDFVSINEIPYSIKTNTSDVGTEIFTLGFPMALSGLGEEVKFTDGKISSKTGYQGEISTYQISVPVQPGNSGGGLFDYDGNLIGIVNAKVLGADNVSYAIKASYLKNLIDVLPIKIEILDNNSLIQKSLTDKIKILSDYVVLIKVK